jgi:hypothetical protein
MNLCQDPDMRVEEKEDRLSVKENGIRDRNQRVISLADECWKFGGMGTGIRAEASFVSGESAR